MSIVLSLKQDDFQGSDGSTVTCWKIELDDRTTPVPCYSGEAAKLKVGEPLPEGWEVRKSKANKDYLAVPKARSGGFGGGGQAAFRNTAEGQRAEQESIWRSVQFQAERSDRRTALMQAVEWGHMTGEGETLAAANKFYNWLRENVEPAASVAQGGHTGGGMLPAPGAAEDVEGAKEPGVTTGETGPPALSTDRPGPEVTGEGASGPGTSSPAPRMPQGTGTETVGTPVAGEMSEGVGTAETDLPLSDHVWIPSPRERLAVKGWVVCSVKDCLEHQPHQEKAAV